MQRIGSGVVSKIRVLWMALVLVAFLAPSSAFAPATPETSPEVPVPSAPAMPESPVADPDTIVARAEREGARQSRAVMDDAEKAARDTSRSVDGATADARHLLEDVAGDPLTFAGDTILRPAEKEVERLSSTIVFETERRSGPQDQEPLATTAKADASDYTVPLIIASATAAAAGVAAIWFAGSTGALGTGAKAATGELRRVLPYASPLFTRFEKETVMGHPKREELYAAIVDRPGVPLHRLCDQTGLSRTAVLHHLRLLEHHHLVISRRVGRSRHYFENGGRYGRGQKEAYAVLQNDRSRSVARFIRDHPGTIQKRMCDALGLQPSIAHWHVRRLQEAALVQPVRQGRTVSYYPSADLQQIA